MFRYDLGLLKIDNRLISMNGVTEFSYFRLANVKDDHTVTSAEMFRKNIFNFHYDVVYHSRGVICLIH